MHGALQRERLALAHPAAQQMGRVTGVAQLRQMRATIAQAEHQGKFVMQANPAGPRITPDSAPF